MISFSKLRNLKNSSHINKNGLNYTLINMSINKVIMFENNIKS